MAAIIAALKKASKIDKTQYELFALQLEWPQSQTWSSLLMAQLKHPLRLLAAALLAGTALAATAQDKVLNLYSARHYQTDEAL
jgi:hypothetical protein